jgi:hypothetical protein
MNAEKENDAQTLAFLAMQSQDEQTSTRLAHQAIALDPSLTWILVDLPFRTLSSHLEQLQRWDPDNAVPYLLRADFLDFQAQVSGKKDQNTILAEMRAEKSEFRQLMKRAFAAPQYDSYLARRLELDRAVMRKHGLDAPMLLLAGLQTHRTPALIHVHFYVTWTMAEAREAAARNGDARALEDACRKAVRFGEKLETQSEFERLTGNQLQQLGDTELADILDRQGKTEEAETLDDTLGRLKHTLQRQLALDGALLDARMMPIYRANPFNPGVVIHVASLVFLLALVFLALTFFYLRLRTAKAETVCALPRMISYAPALLFSSALVLLLTYMPYARVFRMYMIDQEMAKTALAVPMNDPQLLSSLSNLQYPYNFLAASEVSLTVWIAFGVVLAAAIYSFWRMRVSPAKV